MSSRIVYLKELDSQGFVIYSNFGTSRKAADLATNPWASLTFWWEGLERQVRVEGRARRLGVAEFGSEKLRRFLDDPRVRDHSASARPAVDQINVRNCCSVPPPLTDLARAEGIELLTHSDCTDVLPSGTLRELLGQGPGGAGVASENGRRSLSSCSGMSMESAMTALTPLGIFP